LCQTYLERCSRTDSHRDLDTVTEQTQEPDISDFDPFKPRRPSSVECGKGDLDLSWRCQTFVFNELLKTLNYFNSICNS
jgi:hypothetical protein